MSHREPHKQAEIDSRTAAFMANEASKPFGWDPAHFTDWATVTYMLRTLPVPAGGSILDLGCGTGWTSLFLGEAGYRVHGYDLVPANVELARERAERWESSVRFDVADFEDLPAGEAVDAVLVYDALHHSTRQRRVLEGAARRLAPDGWLLLGEPSWLHAHSPGARATRREAGWMERGVGLRRLRRDLAALGFAEPRRFFQPTQPYEDRLRGFAWQLVRLAGANVWVAPQAHLWIAARRRPDADADAAACAGAPRS